VAQVARGGPLEAAAAAPPEPPAQTGMLVRVARAAALPAQAEVAGPMQVRLTLAAKVALVVKRGEAGAMVQGVEGKAAQAGVRPPVLAGS
jgi:hypothetical protein